MKRIKSFEERIATRTEYDTNGGCWLWSGSTGSGGYPTASSTHGGITYQVHREMYARNKGPIPPGMRVCHKCDVSLCINPEHLFLGTHLQNMADMVAKGRNRAQRGAPKRLPDDQRQSLVAALQAGTPIRAISREFGVTTASVRYWRQKASSLAATLSEGGETNQSVNHEEQT